ncbi:hypothetical protein AVEN_118267-1 [Araneus ventricosus]|uniref:Uncharacterized protein n=1 Tax=Araneus ventricosus TaxID=182803 RepID=A0A4Y2DXW7_ARAVE|nr:hypothetical protein AVEN_118267-1 [Araneus ventricosus]
MRSIKVFLRDKRNNLVEEALQFAKDACEEMDIPVVKKRTIRRKAILPREKATDEPLTLDQELKWSVLKCIDRFQQEIDTRCEGMKFITNRFAVMEPSNRIETSETELSKFLQSLVENYYELSADGVLTKIPRIRRFRKSRQSSKRRGWTSLRFSEFVVEYELFDSVPNLFLASRFFLTLCVSVASCERNFSKLIKNCCLENETSKQLSFH